MRVFLAYAIDAAAAADLNSTLTPQRTTYVGRAFRWIPPANYHVTLRFFGELSQESITTIDALIRPIADASAPMQCTANAPQPLPRTRPRVIVLPIASDERLERLAAQCNAALERDFGRADKPFKAHLTIVRCERGARFVAAPIDLAFPLVLARIALFESVSSKAGQRYIPLREYRLGASNG